jgi:hypothetical protein
MVAMARSAGCPAISRAEKSPDRLQGSLGGID